MVKLKCRPTGCGDCPFCYVEKRYSHDGKGLVERECAYCGVKRGIAEFGECPLD